MNVFDQSVKYPFPIYRQKYPDDSGRACLRMISRYFGVDNNFSELGGIIDNKVNMQQHVTLLDIFRAAKAGGFRVLSSIVNYVKLSNEVPLPAIIHWRDKHFMIIYQIVNDQILIADSADGLKNMSKDEFIKHWIKLDIQKSKGNQLDYMPGIVMLLEPTSQIFKAV